MRVRTPFGGLHFGTLLDTYEEWHALTMGFCESLPPWPPRYRDMSEEHLDEIKNEYPYYVFGRTLGFVAFIALIAGVIKLWT